MNSGKINLLELKKFLYVFLQVKNTFFRYILSNKSVTDSLVEQFSEAIATVLEYTLCITFMNSIKRKP